MSTTLVVTGTPNPSEMEAVQSYLKGVMPMLMEAGGTLVKRLKVAQVVNGWTCLEKMPGLMLV